MRKFITIIFCLVLVVVLFGCQSKINTQSDTGKFGSMDEWIADIGSQPEFALVDGLEADKSLVANIADAKFAIKRSIDIRVRINSFELMLVADRSLSEENKELLFKKADAMRNKMALLEIILRERFSIKD